MDSGQIELKDKGLASLSGEELAELKAFQNFPIYNIFLKLFKTKLVDLGYQVTKVPANKITGSVVVPLTGDSAMYALGELYGRHKELDWVLDIPRHAEQEINKRNNVGKKKTKTSNNNFYIN